MATSGQTSAQSAQPVHSSCEFWSAGYKPWLLASLLKTINFLGQAVVQRAQALHRSRFTTIFPIIQSSSMIRELKVRRREFGFAGALLGYGPPKNSYDFKLAWRTLFRKRILE